MTILSQAMDGQLVVMLLDAITDDTVRGVAGVDWEHARKISLSWSGGERRVLLLVMSLTGAGELIDLDDVLGGLDKENKAVVAAALQDCLT